MSGVTDKFGLGIQNEAGQRLSEFCQENALVIANSFSQQQKRWLYTWTSPNDQHWNQIDYIVCSWRWRSCIQSAKTKPDADYGPDHQLLIAKFRLRLKKAGETTRPARYDLNQIPYECAVEVTNRFKELDLVNCVPEELWTEVCYSVQEAMNKCIPPPPPKKEKQEGRVATWGGFTNTNEESKEVKSKGEREWYTQLNTEFQRAAGRDKKVSVNNAKK